MGRIMGFEGLQDEIRNKTKRKKTLVPPVMRQRKTQSTKIPYRVRDDAECKEIATPNKGLGSQ